VNASSTVLQASDLTGSPAWFPLAAADATTLCCVHLDEAAYRQASFLDQRLLHAAPAQALLSAAAARGAAGQLRQRPHYVLHVGHVGSTLVSRLIGSCESFFSVREPALLRALADGTGSPLPLAHLLALLGRTWRPGQRAVVKASSFVSELAGALLTGDEAARAVFMFVPPLTYLRTIFAGENSRAESRALAPARLARLTRRLGATPWRSDPRSEGEKVAMSWLCEMTCLQQAARQRPGQVLWLDFERFLGAPVQGLQQVFQALGAPQPAAQVEALVAGPLMRRYSKAPEHAYDAQLRQELLRAADLEHVSEIRRGLAWLGAVAQEHAEARGTLEATEALCR
jgi:hypothetical protein